jgi:hypothetical protein
MFDHIRTFGLTNRPAGYAQVPAGWERVSDRTPEFNHGVIRYARALSEREMYSFELTPVYASERECVETLIAEVAAQDGESAFGVKEDLRESIAAYAAINMAPSYPIGVLAERFNRKARIWPLGQYRSEAVVAAMVAYLAE